MNVAEDAFIKSTAYTAGNIHDANCFTGILSGNETAACVDSAYQNQTHNKWLKGRYIENRAIMPAYLDKPLDKKAKQFNRTHSDVLCTVERVFGVLKQPYGMFKACYLGIDRNCLNSISKCNMIKVFN
jgi:hypothetical protein